MIQDSITLAASIIVTPAVGSWLAGFYAVLIAQMIIRALKQAI